MNIITAIVIGVLFGWIASVIQPTAGREDLIRNIAAGVAGAFVSSWILQSLFDSANQGGFSIGVIVASFIGAATLLFVVARFKQA
jgi:uncharacterized membrane protein YeaQ/YmgE (transglycosylase-associated protein family)